MSGALPLKELEGFIEAVFAGNTTANCCRRLEAAGIHVEPINTLGQVVELPQTRTVGMVVGVPDEVPGCHRSPSPAVTLNGQYGKTPAISAPPQAGEHIVETLRSFGYSESEIAGLKDSSAVA